MSINDLRAIQRLPSVGGAQGADSARFAAASGSFAATSVQGSQELMKTKSLHLPKEHSITNIKETSTEYIDKINLKEDFKDIWDRKHGETHPYSVLNKKRVQANNDRINDRCRTEQAKLEREFRFLTNQQMSLKKNKNEDLKVQKKSEFLLSDKHSKQRLEFWKNNAKEYYTEAKKSQQKLTDLVKNEYNLHWLLVESNFDVIAEINDSIKTNKKDIKERKEKEKKNENPNIKEKLRQEIKDIMEKTVRLERCVEEFKATKFQKIKTKSGEAVAAKSTDENVTEKPSLEKLNKEARSNRELALTKSLDELHNLKMAVFCLDKLHSETIKAGYKRTNISERAKLLNHRTHIIGALFDVEWIYPETKNITQSALNEIVLAAQSLKSTKDTIVTKHSADGVDLNQTELDIGAVREQKAFIDAKVQELDETSMSVVLSDNEKQIIQDVQVIQYEAHDQAEAAEADYKEIQSQLTSIAHEAQSAELEQLSGSLSKLSVRAQALLGEVLNLSNQLTLRDVSLADTELALSSCQEKFSTLMNEYQNIADSIKGSAVSESLADICDGIETDTAKVLQCLNAALSNLAVRKGTVGLQQVNDAAKNAADNAEKAVRNIERASTLENVRLELEACIVETQRAGGLLRQALDETSNITLTPEQKSILDEIKTNKTRADKAHEAAQAQAQKKYDNAELDIYLVALKNDASKARLKAEVAAHKAQADNTDIEQTQTAVATCQSALTNITEAQIQAKGKTQNASLSENQSQLLTAIETNRVETSGFFEIAQAALAAKQISVKLTLRLATLKNESEQAADNAERALAVAQDSNASKTQTQAALDTCQQTADQAMIVEKIALRITQNVELTPDQKKLLNEIHANKARTDKALESAKTGVKKKHDTALTVRLKQLQSDTMNARQTAEAAALSAQNSNTDIKQVQADVSTCQTALNVITQAQTRAKDEIQGAQLTENQSQLIVAIETNRVEANKALSETKAALAAKQAVAALTTHLLTLKYDSNQAASSAERALSLISATSTEEEAQVAIEKCTKFLDETIKLSNLAKTAMQGVQPTSEQQAILAEIEANSARTEGALAASKAKLIASREEVREVSMYQAVIDTLYYHLNQITQDLKPNFLSIYTSIIDEASSMRSTQFASLGQHFSFAKFAERNKAVRIGSEYTVNSNLDRRSNLTQFINVYQKYYHEFYVRPDLMSQEALDYATNIIQMNMVRLLSGKPIVSLGQKAPDLDQATAIDGVFTRGHIAKAVQSAGKDLKQVLLQEILVVLDKAARTVKCKAAVAQAFNLEPLDQLSPDELKKIFLSSDPTSKEILLNNDAVEKLKIIMDEQKEEYQWGHITEKKIIQAKSLLKIENSLLVKELEARAVLYGVNLMEKQLTQRREGYQQKALMDTMRKEKEKGLAIIETALAEVNDSLNISENQKQEKRAPFEKIQQALKKD